MAENVPYPGLAGWLRLAKLALTVLLLAIAAWRALP